MQYHNVMSWHHLIRKIRCQDVGCFILLAHCTSGKNVWHVVMKCITPWGQYCRIKGCVCVVKVAGAAYRRWVVFLLTGLHVWLCTLLIFITFSASWTGERFCFFMGFYVTSIWSVMSEVFATFSTLVFLRNVYFHVFRQRLFQPEHFTTLRALMRFVSHVKPLLVVQQVSHAVKTFPAHVTHVFLVFIHTWNKRPNFKTLLFHHVGCEQ